MEKKQLVNPKNRLIAQKHYIIMGFDFQLYWVIEFISEERYPHRFFHGLN